MWPVSGGARMCAGRRAGSSQAGARPPGRGRAARLLAYGGASGHRAGLASTLSDEDAVSTAETSCRKQLAMSRGAAAIDGFFCGRKIHSDLKSAEQLICEAFGNTAAIARQRPTGCSSNSAAAVRGADKGHRSFATLAVAIKDSDLGKSVSAALKDPFGVSLRARSSSSHSSASGYTAAAATPTHRAPASAASTALDEVVSMTLELMSALEALVQVKCNMQAQKELQPETLKVIEHTVRAQDEATRLLRLRLPLLAVAACLAEPLPGATTAGAAPPPHCAASSQQRQALLVPLCESMQSFVEAELMGALWEPSAGFDLWWKGICQQVGTERPTLAGGQEGTVLCTKPVGSELQKVWLCVVKGEWPSG
eukprot:gnl/TRDRNA2_/TRDRNA2_112331_c2_seq1.p1 gnl/TRDRNA2_/TRDRNA2_112331_c2~~gnl/TRDRNA2_/TRDRNA2_112331_c2_seq1.p1  ORF type:complete len:367 (+),score=66.77 gnl/TRDRNA2_/TRDRNA2_112331_c2_seq1:51-1151(+)